MSVLLCDRPTAIVVSTRTVYVVSGTLCPCTWNEWEEKLRQYGCNTECIELADLNRLWLRNDRTDEPVLLDAVNPAEIPIARDVLRKLCRQHPLPRALVVFLPPFDYQGLRLVHIPCPHVIHMHGTSDDQAFHFLADFARLPALSH